ncbi:MAG: transcriptional repressor LexA [Kouleothrix sp.]|nr:transcriptional repressor LexA [Kouleothrix sp.]
MRSPDALSNRQKDILGYIEDFVQDNGYPPAIRQIQEKLDISSTSVVAYNLKALESKGLLKRQGKVSRGITIPQTTPVRISAREFTQIPLLGVITAGQPLPDPEDTSIGSAEMVDVPPDIAPAEKLKDVYALRVRGHSMIDALIDDGDIVLLRYQETAENGQMVAARLQEENSVTLKKFYKEGNRVRLQPANVNMEPIYTEAANVRIEGRVVGVLRAMF